MHFKWALVLLSLTGVALCMNLKAQQPGDGSKHRNGLHFEAHSDKQSADQNDDPRVDILSNSTCLNPTYFCSSNLTCCSKGGNIFSCCPIPKGVCCSDGDHCCPPNTHCDVINRRCFLQNQYGFKFLTADWNMVDHHFIKKRSLQEVSTEDFVCPGSASVCQNGTTCELSSGNHGCCPLQQAVCCPDQIHCCPKDSKCDASGTCTRDGSVVSWLTKLPAKPAVPWNASSVFCPGGREECPDGDTCCETQPGEYGCCPYTDAVCCSDGTHCCPKGYKCDISAGRCVPGGDVISGLTKIQATPATASVTCNDGSECPSGNTCCELGSSQFGCCPREQAVCCSDHAHCCPNGYQCDDPAGTCKRGSDILSWLTKKPSRLARV